MTDEGSPPTPAAPEPDSTGSTDSMNSPQATPTPQAAEPAAASPVPTPTPTTPPSVVEPAVVPESPEAGSEPSEVRPREVVVETSASPPPAQPVAPSAPAPKGSVGARMRAGVQTKKHARLEKIVALAAEKRVITNDDVQKLLLVSDSTATRYLKELVKTGRLKLSGKRKHEHYEPL